MTEQLKAVRGMNDILPKQIIIWQYLEKKIRQVLDCYRYEEIRIPIVENSMVFHRGVGAGTDIVEKEMYVFEDKGGDRLTLRPEATAGCVRAGIEHGLLFNQVQRLWTMGPMFRRERPQKGRYRQFHQVSVETFGMSGPNIETELICMAARLWKQIGLSGHIALQINYLGTSEERAKFRDVFTDYLQAYTSELDADSQRRLITNPLRILDSKDEKTRNILMDAPVLFDFLGQQSRDHFDKLQDILQSVEVTFTINPRLVRGLDYYNQTVFEWVTDSLGAQSTVCAGGRYDGLVGLLGGHETSAVGFAMGLERLVLMLEVLVFNSADCDILASNSVDCVFAAESSGDSVMVTAIENIRENLSTMRVKLDCAGGNLKKQLKRADKIGARFVVSSAKEESESGWLVVQSLRDNTLQRVRGSELVNYMKQLCD